MITNWYLFRMFFESAQGEKGSFTFAVRHPTLALEWAYGPGARLARALYKSAQVKRVEAKAPSRWNRS